MKVLLINPSQYSVYGGMYSPDYPPLGLGYIGAVLENANHKVKIIDIDADRITKEKLINILKSFNPSIVGITATTPTFNNAKIIAKVVKKSIGVPVILGGIHATIAPKNCISSKYIDFVVRGEGENTIVELIDELEKNKNNFSKIDGLVFKKNKKIIYNKPRELIKNLDLIPFPARHLFNHQKYTYPDALYHPATPIITSRGCPGLCTYCCTKLIFSRLPRFRSAKNVVDEIEFLVEKYRVKEIHIWDDNFTLAKKRVFEIYDEIKRRHLDLAFAFPNGMRVDQVNYQILKTLKKMGTHTIAFGVESGNQRILNRIKKGITLAQIKKAFRLAKSLKIDTWAFFMMGLPSETNQTINDTIDFAKKIDPDVAKFHILTPFPGTEVFEEFFKNGFIIETNHSKYGIHTPPVHRLQNVNETSLVLLQKKAYMKFYFNSKKIIKQILRLKSWTRFKLNSRAFITVFKTMK